MSNQIQESSTLLPGAISSGSTSSTTSTIIPGQYQQPKPIKVPTNTPVIDNQQQTTISQQQSFKKLPKLSKAERRALQVSIAINRKTFSIIFH